MIFKINLKKLVTALLIPLAVGGLSSLITMGDTKIYKSLKTPPLSPPGIVFPIVWSVLYILMGVSLYLVMTKRDAYIDKRPAYVLFFVQLFLNFLWQPIFFGAKMYLTAFIILVLLFLSVVAMTVSFYKISRLSALLQIPYIIWVAFAGYLNLGIVILN